MKMVAWMIDCEAIVQTSVRVTSLDVGELRDLLILCLCSKVHYLFFMTATSDLECTTHTGLSTCLSLCECECHG